jgi:transcriptional regulator GlxA family with amidase domain
VTDWNEVKKAYIAENCSLKELGKRFGLSPRTIGRRSAAENRRLLRQEYSKATLERALDLLVRPRATTEEVRA